MAWSYEPSTAPSDKNAVRLTIGDTSSSDPLMEDEEITYLLSVHGGITFTSAQCCDNIAAKFSRDADLMEGTFRITASQMARAYERQAVRLRKQGALGAPPYAGGISISDKDVDESNTDVPVPSFRIDMFAHRQQTSSS